jgi:hypothetical protein
LGSVAGAFIHHSRNRVRFAAQLAQSALPC